MADLFEDAKPADIQLVDKVRSLKREIGKRRSYYPRAVQQGKMNHATAEREIIIFEAILDDYEQQLSAEQKLVLAAKDRTKKPSVKAVPSVPSELAETPVAQISRTVLGVKTCRICHGSGYDPESRRGHLVSCRRCGA